LPQKNLRVAQRQRIFSSHCVTRLAADPLAKPHFHPSNRIGTTAAPASRGRPTVPSRESRRWCGRVDGCDAGSQRRGRTDRPNPLAGKESASALGLMA